MKSKITFFLIGLLSVGGFAQQTISSTIAYQGAGETAAFVGQGEFQVFSDNVNGVLDKPIFLLDGFDPGNARNIPAIYNFLNYGTGQNLATDLRAQGYDIVIVNFPTYTRPSTTTVIDGGVDYIQRNAMVLVEIINQINAVKVGNEKNVVIGPSMGGLIARYALRYMEQNTLNHDTRLYVSFDSPHQGANVPIGMQHMFNYLAFNATLPVTAAQPIVNGMLKSPAARQMLIDQLEGHLQTGSPTEWQTGAATLFATGCPNYRTAFQTELDAMGFPSTVRNIAIANGAGNGTGNYTPGMAVMNYTYDISANQRAILELNFTPAANTNNFRVSRFRGQQDLGFPIGWLTLITSAATSSTPSYSAGLDTAPGGRFDLGALEAAAGTDPAIVAFFANLNADYFTFIPTTSALGISGAALNLYAPVTSVATPFAATSVPTVNENHVTLNAQNLAFILNEILNPTAGVEEQIALNSIWIQNPVKDALQINTSYSIDDATISVTDMTGKTIFTATNQTINGTLELPVTLSNGMYLVTIANESGSVTKKVVKG